VAAEKILPPLGRRRWLGAHSLASGEGFHRYMPWCRVVWSATGALGRRPEARPGQDGWLGSCRSDPRPTTSGTPSASPT